MAATYAQCTGHDLHRTKIVHRLGHEKASAIVKSHRTIIESLVFADGSAGVCVVRDGVVLLDFALAEETRSDQT